MSHDLTSMIEEINLASSNLTKSSKTAEADPLSQIVRVLNAHLGQLQQIDVGAEQLRRKVEDAQKEVRGFGGRVGDEGGVEGFMRSLRR
jgi:nuclear pore complex protein Nup62